MSAEAAEEKSVISADIIVMYGVAFFLDLLGIFCFLLTITVVLAPLGAFIQWLSSLFGKVIFTLWVLFFRGQGTRSFFKTVGRGVTSGAKKRISRWRQQRGSRKATSPEGGTSDNVSKTDDTYSPEGTSSSDDTISPEYKYASEETGKDEAVQEEISDQKKPPSLLWKWIKRVFFPWLIETTPILGKIALSWVVTVYLEDKNG